MRSIAFILFFTLALLVQGQDSMKVIGLHPAVGKNISRADKISYSLFPEYNDSLFSSAYIILNTDSSYTLCVSRPDNRMLKRTISTGELDELYRAIDKNAQTHAGDYVRDEKEIKEERRHHAQNVFFNVMGQILLISLQVMLTVALTQ